MIKKIITMISILYLSSLFAVSCNNTDKTGSSNSNNNGIEKYAGTWELVEISDTVTIDDKGNVVFDSNKMNNIKYEGTETYLIEFIDTISGDIFLRLNFSSQTFGIGEIGGEELDKGTIKKIK
ncbi:hypothetical protein DJ52_04055 [Brachyspira murdochii]|uniref:DUF5640 domain-containing protein n=2 Tax=Brachyspira murdochii TaxID=84378 RepID=A0ABX5B5J4_9SPIR|nr:hypothetical protein DJ52_04055 [Brachyspira murdochii]